MSQVIIQRVEVDDLGGRAAEFLFEVAHEPPVFFDQREPDVVGGEKLGQRSQTGADFDHVVAGLDLQASNNPAREVLVVQKILAEAAGRGRLRFRKGTLDFA